MVLDEEDSHFLNVSDAGAATYEERFSIPVEEQNAGPVVDYFYRVEFHSTPRFFFLIAITCFFFILARGVVILIHNNHKEQQSGCDTA